MKIRFNTENDELNARLRARRAELAEIKRTMEMVCTFCPDYILTHHVDADKSTLLVGVLLDIHITGMNRLVDKYTKLHEGGIYKVIYTMNAYLSTIFETVMYWGGDIIKIYGERSLNLWKVSPDEILYEVLHLVILCASIIKQALCDFDTLIPEKLDLKMSITCGNIYATRHGDENKLLVFRGEPLEEIQKLSHAVKAGEVMISAKAWSLMLQDRYNVEVVNATMVRLLNDKFAYKANERALNQNFNIRELEVLQLINIHLDFMKVLCGGRSIDSIDTMTIMRTNFVDRIPKRKAIRNALCYADMNVIRSFICKNVHNQIYEHQPVEYLTGLSTLSLELILISPQEAECLSDKFIRLIYDEVTKSIEGTTSFIYMFDVSVEIKIIVISGINEIYQDIECKKALKSGYALNVRLKDISAINWISCGIFQEYLFCGVVGHPHRRDYVTLGPILHRGFKILKKNTGKVVCDFKTFKFSKLPSFHFRCIKRGKCNSGYDNRQLLHYNEDDTEEDPRASMDAYSKESVVGREYEMQHVMRILQTQSLHSVGIIFDGCNKIGRTLMLKFANKQADPSLFLVVSVALVKLSGTPLATISRIYNQLYNMTCESYSDCHRFLELPTQVINRHNYSYDGTENATSIYEIAKHLINLLKFVSNKILVIIVKNIHFIDRHSWRVLEIIFESCRIRLFATSDFTKGNISLKPKIKANPCLKLFFMKPLDAHWINTLACNLLGVAALEKSIAELIMGTTFGCPGYVKACLTYVLQTETKYMVYMNKSDIPRDFRRIDKSNFDKLPEIITVLMTKPQEEGKLYNFDQCTIASITKEFFFSLDLFDQEVIRTASVLGTLFTRELLRIALKYPHEHLLTNSMKTMFTDKIFECGSLYVTESQLKFNKYTCRCYFPPSERRDFNPQEQYLHCKLLHFKQDLLKEIAYELIPANKKKDLHLLCTDILENALHYCPICLRDPINSFIIAPKYSEIINYCAGDTITLTSCPENAATNIKEVVKKWVYNPCQCRMHDNCTLDLPLRTSYKYEECKCLDMLIFTYKTLIEHSNCAKHLGKQIWYYMIYGYLLVVMNDLSQGIAVLREAHEFCMVDYKNPECEITENYRKFCLGRIGLMTASALLQMRKLKQAKTHLSIAMRQYHIPSLAFKYHHIQLLLKRTFLAKAFSRHRTVVKKTWMRWEVGMCFIIAGKIYAVEGNLQHAKNCVNYSQWLLSQINERVSNLFLSYFNVYDLHRYGLDKEGCIKLQKYDAKEMLINFCQNKGYYAKHMMSLLILDFELKVTSGKLEVAICQCYRIVHMTLKCFVYANNNEVVIWYSLLFTYTMRFKQFYDIMRVIYKNVPIDAKIWYYCNALEITLLTGYAYIPIDELEKDIAIFLSADKPSSFLWDRTYLTSCFYLHLMKLESYDIADKFRPLIELNANNAKRPISMRILLNMIEADITEMRQRMQRGLSYSHYMDSLNSQLASATICAKTMPVFSPRLHTLKAWKHQLLGNYKMAEKELRRAEVISTKQGNVYFQCFVEKLRLAWGGIKQIVTYQERVYVDLNTTIFITPDQWTMILLPYPLL